MPALSLPRAVIISGLPFKTDPIIGSKRGTTKARKGTRSLLGLLREVGTR
jgi:hypothetical protein